MQKKQFFETKEEAERTLKIVRLETNNIKEINILGFFCNPALDLSFSVKVFSIPIQSFVLASSICSCKSCSSNITA